MEVIIDMGVRQLIIVRKDLEMPAGKLAAQVAHASVGAFIESSTHSLNAQGDHEIYVNGNTPAGEWINGEYKKVVLGCKNLNELMKYQKIAEEHNLPSFLVEDLGLTVFNGEKTITCLGVGPIPDEMAVLFKRLQVYK